jgi:hypothetical protein
MYSQILTFAEEFFYSTKYDIKVLRNQSGGTFMNRLRKGNFIIISMLLCFIFCGLSGCSKEATKAKHFERGEKYFSENKCRSA